MSLNQVVRRVVMRGGVTIAGVRYRSIDLNPLGGIALDIVVRPDGSAFADFPAGPLALERVI
jgi:hypothetical protein